MNKKIASIATLIVFISLTFSCHTYTAKKISIARGEFWRGENISFISVYTKSGDLYEFSKKRPAKLSGDKIVGYAINDTGKEKAVSIPLSEIEVVWIKKVDRNKNFIRLFAIVGGIAIYGVVRLITSDPSCPFIYSFDGENYILDAEPYAGAVCQGLKRTEWCGLEHLEEVNGEYRILMTNELDETEYTDELKLVVVDHPWDVRVAPDTSGGILTISNPIAPARAYDREGRDLSVYVSENDLRVWVSKDQEKIPGRKEELKEELIFEFPKPKKTSRAKILFNGSSTLLGSQTLKYYLGLYGKQVSQWYEEVKNLGPAFFKMANTALREELYSLQIRVETENGWESRGMLIGGPFLISTEKVYILDLTGIPGDTLRIKLTPPAAFWKIDYLAVDYSDDLPVNITEIKAVKGTSNTPGGEDVTAILAENDDNYLVMPNTGDSAELVFQAPPRSPGMGRTVILRAAGYYHMHLKADGEPNRDILERIHSEPGFALQHVLKEYARWEKETLEKIKHRSK